MKLIQNENILNMLMDKDILGLPKDIVLVASLSQKVAWLMEINVMTLKSQQDSKLNQKVMSYLELSSVAHMVKNNILTKGNYLVTTIGFHDFRWRNTNELRIVTSTDILNVIKDGSAVFKGQFTFNCQDDYILQYIQIPDIAHQTIIIPKEQFDNVGDLVRTQMENASQSYGNKLLPFEQHHVQKLPLFS